MYIFALIIRVKNKPKYSGEIFTTGESRKNIQWIKRGLVSRYLYFKLYILMYFIFVFGHLIKHKMKIDNKLKDIKY